ncbi:MAG: hypothetical protein ACLVAT_14755 [Lachnospiraceae bacterium]
MQIAEMIFQTRSSIS